jgi:hypothetical protein
MSSYPKARQLTQERLHEVLQYDPDLGTFTWKCPRPGVLPGWVAGTITTAGYRQIEIDFKLFRGGRLAWLYITGLFPPVGMLVDHANGNRADDRWYNLRLATPQENVRNRGLCSRNRSGKVGVCVGRKPGTWEATITINNRTRLLGRFECLGDAVAVRCEAEKHYFGNFARRFSR